MRSRWWIVVLLGLWPLLAGCRHIEQPAVAVALPLPTTTPLPTPRSAPATRLPPPPVVMRGETAEPSAPVGLTLPEREALATATPLPTPTQPPDPTAPPPTFTPPALPGTAAEEHYWLRRPIGEGGVVWTDKIYPYGSTRGGTLRPHTGVEFQVTSGTPVLAAAPGVVVVAGDDATETYGEFANFYGLLVVIEHEARYRDQPVYTLYGHLSQALVVPGQTVAAQTPIGLSGGSGVADGPHLHFEVRVGANRYDATRNPLLWLYPFHDHGVVVGRVQRPNGDLLPEIPVSISRVDAPSGYRATTTYAVGPINADEVWQENFALDDIAAGYYRVTATVGERKYTAETWVYPYRTSFVEIVVP